MKKDWDRHRSNCHSSSHLRQKVIEPNGVANNSDYPTIHEQYLALEQTHRYSFNVFTSLLARILSYNKETSCIDSSIENSERSSKIIMNN